MNPKTLDDLEIIIVNDGSKDETADIAASYVQNYPGTFRLINKSNGGLGSTYNAAIQAATGRYFKTVDADDWVESEGLEALVDIIRQTEADAILSSYYIVDEQGVKKQLVYSAHLKEDEYGCVVNIRETEKKMTLAMHALTYRTEILKRNYTPADEHCFYVDLEYIVYYFRHVKTAYLSDIPVYDYSLGMEGQSVNIRNMVKLRDQHLRVCKSLADCYSDSSIPLAVKRTIEMCALSEYHILLAIPNVAQSKSELMRFEEFLRQQGNRLYKNVVKTGIREKSETAFVVWLLRSLRFAGYSAVHRAITKNLLKAE